LVAAAGDPINDHDPFGLSDVKYADAQAAARRWYHTADGGRLGAFSLRRHLV
jgi:hypothetical protein